MTKNKSIFSSGSYQTVVDVLAAKDRRANFQDRLLKDNDSLTMICAKMNIPGPIKNNSMIKKMFGLACENFEKNYLAGIEIKNSFVWDYPSGPEKFYLIDEDPFSLKKIALAFEDSSSLGRLCDFDVLFYENDGKETISRQQMNVPPRRCFLCDDPAKNCARSRRHKVSELQAKIDQIFLELFK